MPHRHTIHKTWILRREQKKHRTCWCTTLNDNLENAWGSNRNPSNYILIFDDTTAVNAPCLFPRRFRPPYSTSKKLGIHFRMHNQAGTSEFRFRILFSREVHARPSERFTRVRTKLPRTFFFIMPASNTNLTRLPRRRRQLKIVSRRRAVTKRTENDGQPDWQRLCTRHYPLQVLRAAVYLHVSANAAQPRDVLYGERKKEKGKEKKKKRTEKKGERRKTALVGGKTWDGTIS